MNFDLQFFVGVFAVLGGLISLFAFIDSRLVRSKISLKRKIAKVRFSKMIGGAQVAVDAPAFELLLINKGLVPMYPIRFYLFIPFSKRISLNIEVPENGLLPKRSIKHQFSLRYVFENLPDKLPLQKRWVMLCPVVILEDGRIRRGLPCLIRVADLEATLPSE